MREYFRERAGRRFIAVFAGSVAVTAAAPFFFRDAPPVAGVVPAPFAAGLVMIAVILPAYAVYFRRYWPFR